MRAPIYIGDEVTAAGYRLAGAQVRVPAEGEATAAFDEARAHVAAGARLRGGRGEDRRRRCCARALMALAPLVLIVPDAQGEVPLPDLAARLRGQLGMEP